jgi:hypothetical protein
VEAGSAVAKTGGGVGPDLQGVADVVGVQAVGKCGEGVCGGFPGLPVRLGTRRSGMDDGVEERVSGDVLLIKETAFVSGASGVIDADVLGDFASSAGKMTQQTVGDDNEAICNVLCEV